MEILLKRHLILQNPNSRIAKYQTSLSKGNVSMIHPTSNQDKGSVELIVLGLLAALIVVLALPLLSEVFSGQDPQSHTVSAEVGK